ncbi:MbtH family NRPS accessory protein [Streptomyces sp. AM 2-1-1]|uniref:MbtH family NRPS accessory protein n=1 Tax=unclassified Streptomyces TaxID=2593676 RepID=UPI0023B9E3DF|nr:MbtH family NRPS accessory protein [Streptomyces sp. AM 2-1-1]WEH38781.1 MbtH family NRPS accessory protein [Streptomyces sp. AM 2-1-1]
MTAVNTPFDPAPAGAGPTHLVLENASGRRSLWPAWRAVPAGWSVGSGPATYEECVGRLAPRSGSAGATVRR